IGARPQTYQRVTLGATRAGNLTAIRHEVYAHTSFLEDYLESSAFPTRVMYACPNVSTKHRLVQLNLGTPTYTRAPGVATGTYALEVAMDELAYRLKMDPLQLRLLNYAMSIHKQSFRLPKNTYAIVTREAQTSSAGPSVRMNPDPCAMGSS